MVKTWLISFLLVVGCLGMIGCSGPSAVTLGGSSDGDSLISYGKVLDNSIEVGVTGVSFDNQTQGADRPFAVGPYVAYLVKDPIPTDILQDWQPFIGASVLFSNDGDFEAIPKAVGGIIYKPGDRMSPVYFAEKAWPSGAVDSPSISGRSGDLFHWFAFRIKVP